MSNLKEAVTSIDNSISTGDSQSILSRIFRNFLHQLTNAEISNTLSGSTFDVFNTMVERYILSSMRYRHSNITNIKETSSIRGNLKKELLKSSMSWKVFIKSLKFLGVRKFEIRITIHTNARKTFVEEQVVHIADIDMFDFNEDD